MRIVDIFQIDFIVSLLIGSVRNFVAFFSEVGGRVDRGGYDRLSRSIEF